MPRDDHPHLGYEKSQTTSITPVLEALRGCVLFREPEHDSLLFKSDSLRDRAETALTDYGTAIENDARMSRVLNVDESKPSIHLSGLSIGPTTANAITAALDSKACKNNSISIIDARSEQSPTKRDDMLLGVVSTSNGRRF